MRLEGGLRGSSAWRLEEADHGDSKGARVQQDGGGRDGAALGQEVCGEVGSPHTPAHRAEMIESIGELGRADGRRAVSHEIHRLKVERLFSSREVVGLVLLVGLDEGVAGVHEEKVGIFPPQLTQDCGAAGHSARLVHLASAVLQKAEAVAGIGQSQVPDLLPPRRLRRRMRRRHLEIAVHVRENVPADERGAELRPASGTRRQRGPERRRGLAPEEAPYDRIEPSRAGMCGTELAIEVEQDEGRQGLAPQPGTVRGRVKLLQIALDPCRGEGRDVAFSERPGQIVFVDESRRRDRAPRIELRDPIHEPVFLGGSNFGAIGGMTRVRGDQLLREIVQTVPRERHERLPLPCRPPFAGDLIPRRGFGNDDGEIGRAEIPPEEIVDIASHARQASDGGLFLVVRNPRFEGQPEPRVSSLKGSLMERAEPGRGRDQVLRDVRSPNARNPVVPFLGPGRDRVPSLRKREPDFDAANDVRVGRQEKELPPRHHREFAVGVPEAPAGESHVAVPFALPRLDPISQLQRRGQRTAQGETRDVDHPVLDDRGVHSGHDANGGTRRTQHLEIGEPEDFARCMASQDQGVPGNAVETKRDRELVWIPGRRRDDVTQLGGRGARRHEEQDPEREAGDYDDAEGARG